MPTEPRERELSCDNWKQPAPQGVRNSGSSTSPGRRCQPPRVVLGTSSPGRGKSLHKRLITGDLDASIFKRLAISASASLRLEGSGSTVVTFARESFAGITS